MTEEEVYYALSRRGRSAGGQPIGALMAKALARPDVVSLAAGFVDQASLPVEAVRAAAQRVLADPVSARAALQYGSTFGDAGLREYVLEQAATADRGAGAWSSRGVENVCLTAGSNQSLHLIAETLCDPGDVVLCAAPTYFVFLGLLSNLGVRAWGVEADAEGISPEALDAAFAELDRRGDLPGVKALYLVSYFDNPGGSTLSAARRPEVVEIVRRWSTKRTIRIIDDVAYRPLAFGDDAPVSLAAYDDAGDAVISTSTFSKCFSPGVRVGWMALPDDLVRPIGDLKGNIDFGSAHFDQRLVYEAAVAGDVDRQIDRLRTIYRGRADAMVAALKQQFADVPGAHWRTPTGGLYVWLTLPSELDAGPDGPLAAAADEQEVLYVAGEYCHPTEGAPILPNTMRLSFGCQSDERIAEGIRRLRAATEEVNSRYTQAR